MQFNSRILEQRDFFFRDDWLFEEEFEFDAFIDVL